MYAQQKQISYIKADGAWYHVYDESGKKVNTMSKQTVGKVVGWGTDFFVAVDGAWVKTYDVTGKKICTMSKQSAGEVIGVSINSFTCPDFRIFSRMCLYYARQTKKSKDMATTIKTSSKNYFNKIQKYLNNKRVFFTPSLNLGVYALTIFDLNQDQTTSLISKMTKHFHLSPKQQEPLALAA